MKSCRSDVQKVKDSLAAQVVICKTMGGCCSSEEGADSSSVIEDEVSHISVQDPTRSTIEYSNGIQACESFFCIILFYSLYISEYFLDCEATNTKVRQKTEGNMAKVI